MRIYIGTNFRGENMNIKQYGLILLTMVTVIACVFSTEGKTMPAESNTARILATALETTGAQPDQITIHGWTVLPQSDATEQDLEALAEKRAMKSWSSLIFSSALALRSAWRRAANSEDCFQKS